VSERPRVKLMLTCLCDAFYGEVGIATVRVLEHAGCEVVFPEDQTCCGQPPFNAGAWAQARSVAEHCIRTLEPFGQVPVVTPSGSCAAMLREGYPMLFPDRPHANGFELAEFLVKQMGIETWPGIAVKPRRVAFHRACHGRALHLGSAQERLVGSVQGIELVPFAQGEQCCGFGGAFAATHGKLSSGIGLEKLRNVVESGAEELVSGDMGCLMHLDGLIKREGLPLKVRHFAEILAEAIPA
jgi:L-lactate dehydrogenase complex protein LldE